MKKIKNSVLAESNTALRAFVGRNICSLTLEEKNNPLIAKLLERIRKPSLKEFTELSNVRILVIGGKCRAFIKEGEKLKKLRTYNLGTAETPAFFYNKFIFVLDKEADAFVATDIKIVYFNDNYAVAAIADNLFFVFDVKGLSPMGQIKSVHVLPDAYVVTATRTGRKIAVYGFASEAQKLFEVTDSSYFEISDTCVDFKGEDGCIEETYFLKEGKFVCF